MKQKRNSELSGNDRISPEEAAAVIEAQRNERAQQAQQEINEILEKYNCRLEATVILRAGQVIPQIEVVATDAP